MPPRSPRRIAVALIAAPLAATLAATLAAPGAALAQPVPSTDSLIRSLRPAEPQDGTRGVLRLPRQGAPDGAAQPAAASRPEVSLQIRFGFDSAALTPQATAVLDNLGRAMNSPSLALYRFRLVGHTDGVGEADYNQRLSERRAAAAREYLMQRWGIDATRLVAEGRGLRELFDKADPASAANRRVQVINEGPAG